MRDDELAAWRAYRRSPTAAARNRLIELYWPFVQQEARRLARRLLPDVGAEAEDLAAAGVEGLIRAIECLAFDERRPGSFQGFARLRVRGAMLNSLRRLRRAGGYGLLILPASALTDADGEPGRMEELAVDESTPPAAAAAASRDALRKLTEGLTPEQAAVLIAYDVDELSIAQAAAAVGVAVAAAIRLRDSALAYLQADAPPCRPDAATPA